MAALRAQVNGQERQMHTFPPTDAGPNEGIAREQAAKDEAVAVPSSISSNGDEADR